MDTKPPMSSPELSEISYPAHNLHPH